MDTLPSRLHICARHGEGYHKVLAMSNMDRFLGDYLLGEFDGTPGGSGMPRRQSHHHIFFEHHTCQGGLRAHFGHGGKDGIQEIMAGR